LLLLIESQFDEVIMSEATVVGAETANANAPGLEEPLRVNAWSLLGRLLASPPDEQVLELLAGADGAAIAGDNLLGAAWDLLAKAAAKASPAEIEDEYQDLFIGVGRGELMPYGSWYLTGFLMEQPLARLRGELSQLGFARRDGVKEPEDHAAALCDVMAMISTGEDAAPLDVQTGFFSRHIAPWMGRFFRDMQQAPSARFYRAVGQLGEQFVALEGQHLNAPVKVSASGNRPAMGLS
jgi:TorA maturation chaperone TorD